MGQFTLTYFAWTNDPNVRWIRDAGVQEKHFATFLGVPCTWSERFELVEDACALSHAFSCTIARVLARPRGRRIARLHTHAHDHATMQARARARTR